MEEKSWIVVSEGENNEKFTATRKYRKWEGKFMTGVDHTFSSEVRSTPVMNLLSHFPYSLVAANFSIAHFKTSSFQLAECNSRFEFTPSFDTVHDNSIKYLIRHLIYQYFTSNCSRYPWLQDSYQLVRIFKHFLCTF